MSNTKRISYRVPDQNHKALEKAASKLGLTTAAFARMAALEKAREVLKDG